MYTKHGMSIKSVFKCNICHKILQSKVSLNKHNKIPSGEKCNRCKQCNNHSVKLALSRPTFEPTAERNHTVVSNVLTPAQHPVTSKHICLTTLEENHLVVSNVIIPAQHPVASEHICLHTLEENHSVVSNVLIPAQHSVASEHICLHTLEENHSVVSNVLISAHNPVTSEHTCFTHRRKTFQLSAIYLFLHTNR